MIKIGTQNREISQVLSQVLEYFFCRLYTSWFDSVCPEIFTYKFVSLGIRGKTGRCIISFTHTRQIQVLWKKLLSGTASCTQGVPQGNMLSPLLFLLYTLDIVETLDTGTNMIIYADILVYVIDPNDDHALHKIPDTQRRRLWKISGGPERQLPLYIDIYVCVYICIYVYYLINN